jgi:hypothetical protein
MAAETDSEDECSMIADDLSFLSQVEFKTYQATLRVQKLEIQKEIKQLRKRRSHLLELKRQYKIDLKKRQTKRELEITQKFLDITSLVHLLFDFLPIESWLLCASTNTQWWRHTKSKCSILYTKLVSSRFHFLIHLSPCQWLACLSNNGQDTWGSCWESWITNTESQLFDTTQDTMNKRLWLLISFSNGLKKDKTRATALLSRALNLCMSKLARLLVQLGGTLPPFPSYNYVESKHLVPFCPIPIIKLYLEQKVMTTKEMLAKLMSQSAPNHLIHWMLYDRKTNPFECNLHAGGECDCVFEQYRNFFGPIIFELASTFLEDFKVTWCESGLLCSWRNHSIVIPLKSLQIHENGFK